MTTPVLGALSFLDTPDVNGSLVLTSATGLTAAQIVGTVGVLTVTGTSTLVIDIADNPIIGGTSGMVIPTGTTAQRPTTPTAGELRFNSTTAAGEFYSGSAWVPIGKTLQTITANIAATTGTANKTTTTIPLVSEGIAVWSQVLTPLVTGSTVLCQFSLTVAATTAARQVFVAVFAGSTCVAMSSAYITTAATALPPGLVTIPVQCAYTTTSTASVTFSCRVGTLVNSSVVWVNQSSASTYGAALQTEYRLTELM